MDDLISRRASIKAIEDLQDCYNGFSDTYDKACIIGVLEELPSVQPEIIMCKDCKWWDFAPDNTMLPDWHRCRWYGRMHTRYDDFCSRAERRE